MWCLCKKLWLLADVELPQLHAIFLKTSALGKQLPHRTDSNLATRRKQNFYFENPTRKCEGQDPEPLYKLDLSAANMYKSWLFQSVHVPEIVEVLSGCTTLFISTKVAQWHMKQKMRGL